MGLPHAIAVTTADVTDRDGAIQMILLNQPVRKFCVNADKEQAREQEQIRESSGLGNVERPTKGRKKS